MEDINITASFADQAARLTQLRATLTAANLNGFVVPRADEFQGEYVPARAQRLGWLTGFTGSAGLTLVLDRAAAIFVDGRYTLQVTVENDATHYQQLSLTADGGIWPPGDWLARQLNEGDRFGYDPWLHTRSDIAKLRQACDKAGATLVATTGNPIDGLWGNRPNTPPPPLRVHDVTYAGIPAGEKRQAVAAALKTAGVDAAILSDPASVAWLLNIRGADIPFAPFPLCYAVVDSDAGVVLFAEAARLGPELVDHFGPAVTCKSPDDIADHMDALGQRNMKIRANPTGTPVWFIDRLRAGGAKIDFGPDPCALPKARKNAIELAGAHAAHIRDGAAMARFLCWLETAAPAGGLSERAAAAKLEACRAADPHYRGPSFSTIAGSGPNGAIVHYRVSADTDRDLQVGELFLLDSGGQYPDGTTDVTRTTVVGAVPPGDLGAEMRANFTRVLQGHIALARVRFPKGTAGPQLDTLARLPLWQAGLDYNHGTGHGVGSYLSVHEGPQRIAKVPNTVALEPGMILSNEPGYYRPGLYGIRIENLVTVAEAPAPAGAAHPLYCFENLTRVPIDRRLIDTAMLSPPERAYLDAYHAQVRSDISPLLDAETKAWLDAQTVALD